MPRMPRYSRQQLADILMRIALVIGALAAAKAERQLNLAMLKEVVLSTARSFGVIVVILMVTGLISPPEGVNLYVIHGICKTVMEEAGEEPGPIMEL